jgi:hypothetical protein
VNVRCTADTSPARPQAGSAAARPDDALRLE